MNFKRIIATLFTVYYLSISMGFAVNLHFCGGELESVSTSLFQSFCGDSSVETSCCLPTDDDSGCCDNEEIDFNEVDSETVILSFDNTFLTLYPELYNEISFNKEFNVNIVQALPYYTYESNAPPLYKLHCSLVFYA